MTNQKQDKATSCCKTELIRHRCSFLKWYWSFSFSSSSLFAPQPSLQSFKNLSTDTEAACSSVWPTQSGSQTSRSFLLPTQQPCTWGAAELPQSTTPGENPHVFGLDGVVHQMCYIIMHCGNWYPASFLSPWLDGGSGQRQLGFYLSSWDNKCEEIQEKVKYSYREYLTWTTLCCYVVWDRYCNSH